MARDVMLMGGGGAEENLDACREVWGGGEGGEGVTPESVRVCARAIAGGGKGRGQLLRFNIIVCRS